MAEQALRIDLPPEMPAPALEAALAGPVPDVIIAAWHELAGSHAASGKYLAALKPEQSLRYPYLNDPNTVAVVNTAPHAQFLEEGHAGFHLASRWGRRGGQWKISQKGTLYARVPFRTMSPAGSPGGGVGSLRLRRAMPESLYSQLWPTAHRHRVTGLGDLYKQSKSYVYYRQLFGQVPPELSDVAGYTWRTSQFEGMRHVKMPTPGGGHQAWYQTIRTITPDSPGWFIPPTPAYHFAERALEKALPAVTMIIEQAAARDAVAALADAVKELA